MRHTLIKYVYSRACAWLLLVCSISPCVAQENLRKEKIYTLTTHERLDYEENNLGLYQDELGYIVVTVDTKDFARYYHIKGRIYGPFERRLVEKPVFNLDTWGFIDSHAGKSYVIFNGKEIGVHNEPAYPVGLKIAQKTWTYVLIDQVEGNTKVIINGKEYGPYTNLYNYYLSNDGERWAIAYNESPDEFYILFNTGEKIGPYRNVHDFRFLDSKSGVNRWVLLAEKQGMPDKVVKQIPIKQLTVINNYGEVGNFEAEKVGFPSFDFKNLMSKGANYGLTVVQNQNFYYLANDNLYGPYQSPVSEIDMGEEYNKFNYIVPETRNLHFTGEGIFSRGVSRYFVSESRRTIAILKKAAGGRDSLFVNDKYFKGIYPAVQALKFAPNSEEWAMLTTSGNNMYQLQLSDGRSFGPFEIDTRHQTPVLLLGREVKNWALFYVEAGTGKSKLLVNNQERKESFIGNVAFVREGKREYFSWFSVEERTVYLNKLLME